MTHLDDTYLDDTRLDAPSEPMPPLARRLAVPSLAALGAIGVFEYLRARLQKSRVFAPSRYPEGDWDPSLHGLPHRDIWFETDDGVRLHAWWLEHKKPRATVLYCHGNLGSIGDRIDIFRQLQRLRVSIFAFDYRGYGKSQNIAPSEAGLFHDVRAAHDVLTGELGVDPAGIILFGHSLGGAVAIEGALHRPVAGLVVQASFTDLAETARHLHPSIRLLCRNQFRSILKVPRLEMPKLFLHGTADAKIPFEMGQRLYASAAGPKTFFPVPGAGHSDLHLFGGKSYFRVLARFRERCVS